jgi:hypothetical protein
MTPPNDFVDRLASRVPAVLAWPMSALAMLLAFTGGLLIFLAAALGSITAAVWSAISFTVAAIAWHIGDFAEGNHSL